MKYLQQFAHAEELHSESTSDLEHVLTSAPVALPLYVAINLLLFYGLKDKKPGLVIPALLGFNLIIGIASYELVPVVSIIAITVGICLALLISLTLIAK